VQETYIFDYAKGLRDESVVAQRRHTEAMAAKDEQLQQMAMQIQCLQSQISGLRPVATRHTEAMAAKDEELQQMATQVERLQSEIGVLRPVATLFWNQTRSLPEIGEVCLRIHNSTSLLFYQP
jgi:uncharacterized protein (DUF3084 family)